MEIKKNLQGRFNLLSDEGLKITMIKKTFPNLAFQSWQQKRVYI